MTEWLHFHFSLSCIGEGNGNPLQCSCLENPRDWGAWWAAVYGVAQSQTWLKRLSSSSSNVHLVKAMFFPVVLYECEILTIKNSKCWRIVAFELWCWWRVVRVPWTARRSNQSIVNEISPEYSLEGLMLKLKFQYFGHLVWRTNLLEKTLMLGKMEAGGEGDDRGWDSWIPSLI